MLFTSWCAFILKFDKKICCLPGIWNLVAYNLPELDASACLSLSLLTAPTGVPPTFGTELRPPMDAETGCGVIRGGNDGERQRLR